MSVTLKETAGRTKISHCPDLDFFREKNNRVGMLLLIHLKLATPNFFDSNFMKNVGDYDWQTPKISH